MDDEIRIADDQSRDAKLFCNRCWRLEYHFHTYRARRRNAYFFWCLATFGFLYLLGPYRCRCCGIRRLWRVDIRDAQKQRLRGAKKRTASPATHHYKPFRRAFSLSRLIRGFFRAIGRLNPFRRRGHRRRSRRHR
jgi:hypothetical protein